MRVSINNKEQTTQLSLGLVTSRPCTRIQVRKCCVFRRWTENSTVCPWARQGRAVAAITFGCSKVKPAGPNLVVAARRDDKHVHGRGKSQQARQPTSPQSSPTNNFGPDFLARFQLIFGEIEQSGTSREVRARTRWFHLHHPLFKWL